jgi:hypothetical protein
LLELNEKGDFNFVERGEYLDFYLYKHVPSVRKFSVDEHPAAEKREASPPGLGDNKSKSG